jgi:hypothetical protein
MTTYCEQIHRVKFKESENGSYSKLQNLRAEK